MEPIKQHHQRIIASICFFLMLTALFIGGHQPGSGTLFPTPWDKLVHFIFYGVLTILGAFAFPKIPLPLLGLIMIGIGGADEMHQIFVPGRFPGLDDLAADITGCLLALYLTLWIRTKYEKIA